MKIELLKDIGEKGDITYKGNYEVYKIQLIDYIIYFLIYDGEGWALINSKYCVPIRE